MGKGSKRRPAAIDERSLAERWASINWNDTGEDEDDPPAPEDPHTMFTPTNDVEMNDDLDGLSPPA